MYTLSSPFSPDDFPRSTLALSVIIHKRRDTNLTRTPSQDSLSCSGKSDPSAGDVECLVEIV